MEEGLNKREKVGNPFQIGVSLFTSMAMPGNQIDITSTAANANGIFFHRNGQTKYGFDNIRQMYHFHSKCQILSMKLCLKIRSNSALRVVLAQMV
jgi:hypothetical protein